MTTLQHIITNLGNTALRKAKLHGRSYLVAPMAMMTEGVHNGSGGQLFYPASELRQAVPAWNMKPIVVYHPEIDGKGVSACNPDILERQQVGMVMNTRWAGKQRAEAWIDEELAGRVDSRVLEALENNQMMEVSTGLFTANEDKQGTWNGKPYDAVARNHAPDHLALLPDKVGACSIADGAGLLQLNDAVTDTGVEVERLWHHQFNQLRRIVGNAMSHGQLHGLLSSAVRAQYGDETWVLDVFDKEFVYETARKLYRRGFAKKGETVTLSDDQPTEVVQVTEYRPVPDPTLTGNTAKPQEEGKKRMTKKQTVAKLVDNKATTFTAEDAKWLEALDEASLDKLVANTVTTPAAPAVDDQDDKPADKPAAPAADAAPQAPTANMSFEQFLATAPAEYGNMLRNSLAEYNKTKADLVAELVANKANTFTQEYLSAKPVEELRGLVALAQAAQPVVNESVPVPMFVGQAVPANLQRNDATPVEQRPLPTPRMVFEQAVQNGR